MKKVDDVANYYWSVLKECVRGCGPSIYHNWFISTVV